VFVAEGFMETKNVPSFGISKLFHKLQTSTTKAISGRGVPLGLSRIVIISVQSTLTPASERACTTGPACSSSTLRRGYRALSGPSKHESDYVTFE